MGLFNIFKKQNPQKDSWVSTMPKEVVDRLLKEIKSNPQACNLDKIPQGFGLFGLEKTNPIPIYGLPENEDYLHSLRTLKGSLVGFRRNGCIEVGNIVKPFDEYEIYNSTGDTIAKLYLSPYHWKTSKKSPRGFKLIN
jgi:hypothetical protein